MFINKLHGLKHHVKTLSNLYTISVYSLIRKKAKLIKHTETQVFSIGGGGRWLRKLEL